MSVPRPASDLKILDLVIWGDNNFRFEEVKEKGVTMKLFVSLLFAVLLASLGPAQAFAQSTNCGSTYVVQPDDYLTGIAQKCGVRYSALLAANPQIKDPNVIVDGHIINIPNGSSGNGNAGNGGIPVTGGSVYIVQPGDSLSSVADHFGISVSGLTGANPMITQRQNIYPGMRLTLPQGADRVPTVSVTPTYGVIGTKVTLSVTGFRANTTVVVGFGPAGKTYYQLDSTTTDANGAVNGSYVIPDWKDIDEQDGQYVFSVQRADDAGIHATSNPFYLTGTGNLSGIPLTGTPVYVVQQEDTLSSIADRYGTTANILLALNPAIGSARILYPGQRIRLPMENPHSGPYVYLSTQVAKPGERIQVRAVNFLVESIVDVRIAKPGEPFTGVVDGRANSVGEVNAEITIPTTANAGEKWVVIVTTTESVKGIRAVSQPITITQ